jgi:hypothetical protein
MIAGALTDTGSLRRGLVLVGREEITNSFLDMLSNMPLRHLSELGEQR